MPLCLWSVALRARKPGAAVPLLTVVAAMFEAVELLAAPRLAASFGVREQLVDESSSSTPAPHGNTPPPPSFCR
jgi:hypothetical protein